MSAQVSEVTQSAGRSVSCISCRQKKLRCDRSRPCGSCVKRGLYCAYGNPVSSPNNRIPAAARRGSTRHLNERLQQLEEIVRILQGENSQHDFHTQADVNGPLSQAGSLSSGHTRDNSPSNVLTADRISDSEDGSNGYDRMAGALGTMRVEDTSISYISGVHWAALQHSIAEIKEYIDSDHSLDDLQPVRRATQPGPALLSGICPPCTKQDCVAVLPPRPTIDRLISRFFNSMEPGVLILHRPTFQKEYEQFWAAPQDMSFTWLSLLFSIMYLASHLHLRSEGESAEYWSDPKMNRDIFREQAASCLISANYITPSTYTIEALLLYTQSEYFRSPDSQHEVWVVMGIIMRLAMRLGFHRDASHFPEISCFQGEMRRRIWALMSQLDSLFSYQMGLPRLLRDGIFDTQLPHNLRDEDFDASSTALPASRPDTDETPISYLIAKSQIVTIFGLIVDQVSSTKPSSYQIVLDLDSRLREAYSSVAPYLKFRDVDQSLTELPHIIMQRYNLDILYLKSFCVLHRDYLAKGRFDQRYRHSRRTCLDSAMKILKHQAVIDEEVKPGGVLSKSRWFVSSLTSHDFILAAMIICLELHNLAKFADPRISSARNMLWEPLYTKEVFLGALRTSHRIWNEYKEQSADAQQAWRSITIMLHKVKGLNPQAENRPEINRNVYNTMDEPSVGMMLDYSGGDGVSGSDSLSPGIIEHNNGELHSNANSYPAILLPELSSQHISFLDDGSLHTDYPTTEIDIHDIDGMMTQLSDMSDEFDWQAWDVSIMNPNPQTKGTVDLFPQRP